MKFLAMAALVFASTSPALATTVLQPVSVTSSINSNSPNTLPNLINQSNLSVKYSSGVTSFDDYIDLSPTDTNNSNALWVGQIGVFSADLIFDLGDVFSLSGLALWNRVVATQGVKDFELTGSTTEDFSSPTLIGSFVAAPGIGTPFDLVPVQHFDFPETLARYVMLSVTSVHGACCVSLGEVAFRGAPPVAPIPLPGGVLGAMTAFALLGFVARRRTGLAQ